MEASNTACKCCSSFAIVIYDPLATWQDGHTGGEHCSGSPIKLTARTWNIYHLCKW
jgi:hypothetical protein